MWLKEIIRKNTWFFIPYLVILLLVTIPLAVYPKASLHLFINSCHSSFWDIFFKYITNFGDGFFGVTVGVLFLLISFRKSFFILATYAGSGIFVQLLKRVIFSGVYRPVKFFEGISQLHLVEGVKMRYYFSFPSGHSASSFGLFLCLAMISGNKTVKFCCLVLATLVAFSRVYLSQHFLIDAYAGSIIGVIFVLIMYRFVFLLPAGWVDKNLVNIAGRNKCINRKVHKV